MAEKYFHYSLEDYGNSIPYLKMVEILSKYDLKGKFKRISFDNSSILLIYDIEEIDYRFDDFYLPIIVSSIKNNEIRMILRFDELINDRFGRDIKIKILNIISAFKMLP